MSQSGLFQLVTISIPFTADVQILSKMRPMQLFAILKNSFSI